jgi:hypothetical protein
MKRDDFHVVWPFFITTKEHKWDNELYCPMMPDHCHPKKEFLLCEVPPVSIYAVVGQWTLSSITCVTDRIGTLKTMTLNVLPQPATPHRLLLSLAPLHCDTIGNASFSFVPLPPITQHHKNAVPIPFLHFEVVSILLYAYVYIFSLYKKSFA